MNNFGLNYEYPIDTFSLLSINEYKQINKHE